MNAHSQSDRWALLRQLFGDNRAEWPPTKFGELFVAPPYLRKLESMRPCFLVGGRGTGKTTTLQSLRYDAALRRLEDAGLSFSDQAYFGVLVRMNKNRVRAFQGKQLQADEWARLFAHYVNLLVCLELVGLATWLERRMDSRLQPSSVAEISRDLGLGAIDSLSELDVGIRSAISKLQLYVNNPTQQNKVILSVAEAPLRTTVEVFGRAGLLGSQIVFCCIDEYENLLEYQQSIVNTYIKHAAPPLSYKIGVRKNGIQSRHTLDASDVLNNPDDYAEIEIAEEGFEYFAKAVAEHRLHYARRQGLPVPVNLQEFLRDLSVAQEATLLGGDRVAEAVLDELRTAGEVALVDYFRSKSVVEVFFLRYWEKTGSDKLVDLAQDWYENPDRWATRLSNYGFASLFWLSVGRKGARIRKYFCGERVLLTLAGGNIRYFLDLLDTSINLQIDKESSDTFVESGDLVITPQAQTLAAREVGRRRLNQLEGDADHGPHLKRLVLAIGKVFFERTRSATRGTPEQNSFVLSGRAHDIERLTELLSEGVGHLAFEVEARTKATSTIEMKDDEFRLHRIFSAFFEISHRKKRRTTFDAATLLAVLNDNPGRAIASLLDGQAQCSDDVLPEQLAFFSNFYSGTQ